MEFKIIEYKSDEYDQMVKLRSEVLRKPLGRVFTQQDLEKDKNDWLLGISCTNESEESELVGCCILTPLSEYTVQLRQMAIAESHRGKGLGEALLNYAEKIAAENYYEYVYLHAREVALRFYEKQGYNIEGERFIEIGIPHFEMMKKI